MPRSHHSPVPQVLFSAAVWLFYVAVLAVVALPVAYLSFAVARDPRFLLAPLGWVGLAFFLAVWAAAIFISRAVLATARRSSRPSRLYLVLALAVTLTCAPLGVTPWAERAVVVIFLTPFVCAALGFVVLMVGIAVGLLRGVLVSQGDRQPGKTG